MFENLASCDIANVNWKCKGTLQEFTLSSPKHANTEQLEALSASFSEFSSLKSLKFDEMSSTDGVRD